MSELKTSKAQLEANKRYRAKNPEKTRNVAFRNVKSFIKNHATKEELYQIKIWIDQKLNNEEIK